MRIALKQSPQQEMNLIPHLGMFALFRQFCDPSMAGVAEPEDESSQFALEPQGLPSTDAGIFSALPLAEGESAYGFDGRGSVTAAFDVKGELLGSAAFSIAGTIEVSFGELPSRDWNAEEIDSTTGLVYLRARFLMSGTLSFSSQDTYLGQVTNPASQNRYAFAEGDPVNAIDATGHISYAQRKSEYIAEAQRRRTETLMAKYVPSTKTQAYQRRTQWRAAHPEFASSQAQANAYQLAAMPDGQARTDLAWAMYNNGWINKAAAEKYCSQYLHMGKEAPKPMDINQAIKAAQSLQQSAMFTAEIVQTSTIVGGAAARSLYPNMNIGQESIKSTIKVTKTISKPIMAVGIGIEVCSTASEVYEIWTNPNISLDRAMTDTAVEMGYGAVQIGASFVSGAITGATLGLALGPVGIAIGAVLGLAVGVAAFAFDYYVEENNLKGYWKDALYDFVY